MKSRSQSLFRTTLKRNLKDVFLSALYRFNCNNVNLNPLKPIQNIHFICHGNICRSAFAEKLAKRLNSRLLFTSSGLSADQANASPENAIKAASLYHVDLKNHVPQKTSIEIVKQSDIVLGMHYMHFTRFREKFPEDVHKFYLLKHWAISARWFINIHDPFNKPYEEYLTCFSIINDCIVQMAHK